MQSEKWARKEMRGRGTCNRERQRKGSPHFGGTGLGPKPAEFNAKMAFKDR